MPAPAPSCRPAPGAWHLGEHAGVRVEVGPGRGQEIGGQQVRPAEGWRAGLDGRDRSERRESQRQPVGGNGRERVADMGEAIVPGRGGRTDSAPSRPSMLFALSTFTYGDRCTPSMTSARTAATQPGSLSSESRPVITGFVADGRTRRSTTPSAAGPVWLRHPSARSAATHTARPLRAVSLDRSIAQSTQRLPCCSRRRARHPERFREGPRSGPRRAFGPIGRFDR